MRFPSLLLLVTLCSCSTLLTAQTPDPSQPAAAKPIPSATMQPALDSLQQALSTVRLEKWKTSGAAREETEANISSIHRDLEGALPSLLANADAAPNTVTHLLPAFNNIGALYDVLLRVTAVSKLSAPAQQSAALDQAMTDLETARHALSDRLQSNAAAQEQQVSDLKASLRAVPATPTPIAVACPPPAPPAKKRKPAPKKPAKPATPATTPTPASH
jgi:hypothetical protein